MSGDRLAPTLLQLSYDTGSNIPGSNVIAGSVGRPVGGPPDRDYLHVVVPQGFVWTELRVGNQVSSAGPQGSFIGLSAGSTMPVAETASSDQGLLGWTLYNVSLATTDILDDMASAGNGAAGFARPLAAGSYTLWLQETSGSSGQSFNYRFNLILSPVPEPGSLLLALLGLGMVVATKRRN
jgi:hypothetical protein